MQTIYLLGFLLSIVLLIQTIEIHRLTKDCRLNYIMIQTIFAYIHNKEKLTVEDLNKLFQRYVSEDIEYISNDN